MKEVSNHGLKLMGQLTHASSELFEQSAEVISLFGGIILLYASLKAIGDTIIMLLQKITKNQNMFGSPKSLNKIRLNLGKLITYSLELLVAGDVIETLTKSVDSYKIETLYKIGLVVIIRTALSYFLGIEIKEIEETESMKHLKHQEHSIPKAHHE